jgi:hypothetical protein
VDLGKADLGWIWGGSGVDLVCPDFELGMESFTGVNLCPQLIIPG